MVRTKSLWCRLGVKPLVLCIMGFGLTAQAALPPEFQNAQDLEAMLSYVKASPEVMADLQAIDLLSKTVYYGDGCTAVFERLEIEKPAGWVGPADPLVLKEASCPSMEFDDADAGALGDESADSITSRDTEACDITVGQDAMSEADASCSITGH